MSLVSTRPGATSPFIPGSYLQFAWDSVSLGSALACWRRYQLSIIEGWKPNGGGSAIALTFGIAFHKGMEFYYTYRAADMPHEEAVIATVRDLLQLPETARLPTHEDNRNLAEDTDEDDDGITLRNSKVRTRYHLIRSVVWYLEHYKNDPASTIILSDGTAAVEHSFRVPLPIDCPELGGTFLLSGHFDRLVSFNGQDYVLDYKTTKSLSTQFFSSWALAHQLSGYTFAGQTVLHRPVAGVLVDGIALQVGGCKFGRAPTPRSKGQLDEFMENVSWLTTQARALSLQLLHNPRFQYPMNTQSCYFCDFKEICRHPPEYRRRYLAMHFYQDHPWNPLENR